MQYVHGEFPYESPGERILKIGSHLPKLLSNIKGLVIFWNTVYLLHHLIVHGSGSAVKITPWKYSDFGTIWNFSMGRRGLLCRKGIKNIDRLLYNFLSVCHCKYSAIWFIFELFDVAECRDLEIYTVFQKNIWPRFWW